MLVDISAVNVLAELERCKWEAIFVSDTEIKCRCPFHGDKNPSCTINVENKLFKCHAAGCGREGDFISFLACLYKTTRYVILEELGTRYELAQTKIIEGSTVEKYHKAIGEAGPLLVELYKRGVTDEMIRKYRIGFDKGRITIPIPNQQGYFVNVRRYLPGAPTHDKMKNTRGYGGIRLFPIEQLKYDTIVICGGELKAIVAAHHLNPHGIGAICATAGEGNWKTEFSKLLRSKRVYVCMDIDQAGVEASDLIAARIKSEVSWVGVVHLDLDPDKYPKGDINDYFGVESRSVDQFLALLASTQEWKPKAVNTDPVDEDCVEALPLAEAVKAENTKKRIRVAAVISAIDTTPYIIPKDVACTCDRNEKYCGICPVFPHEIEGDKASVNLRLHPESPAILELVAAPKKIIRDVLREGLRIPPCRSVEFTAKTFYNVQDVRLSPQLSINDRSTENVMQPALCIGHGLEANESYEMVGRMYPHPKTQQSVLLISEYTPTKDVLSTYQPHKDELNELYVFQPRKWTVDSIQELLDELYADFEANVTRIFQRFDLHFVMDLVYHSPLLLNFDGRIIKGWAEALIVGDSAQGKTETSIRLMEHYGLGERMECKNATVAGLLGGLQQLGNRWFVTWGIIPTHDRRLVILEELKGTSVEVIGKLTDMRSSGIAEIDKIEKRRTHARTRLIAISNPRSDRLLASYNFGIEAIKELIGGLEDIRRFDISLIVSASQIDSTVLNQLTQSRPRREHRFTSDLCRRCVLWAWTRQVDQVIFTPEATSNILKHATDLCSRYTEQVPLVDRGSMRYKLARLAAGLACRTFSCSRKDPQVAIVRECHVDYIVQYLDRIYSDAVFGYKDFSDAINCANNLLDPRGLSRRIMETPFPRDFIEAMLHTNDITLRDLQDWCGWERPEAMALMSLLVRKHALVREGYAYRKTPPFINLLKDLLESDELKKFDRPEYIEEF